KRVIRLEKVLDILERKGRNRNVVVALARQPRFDAGALSDEATLREVTTAAERYLALAAPDLVPVSFAFEEDREHACLPVVALTRANAAAHRNVFARELLLSAEFREARRIARAPSPPG